jgi:hypothetical protein
LPYGNLSYIFEGRNPMAIQLRGRQKIAEATHGMFKNCSCLIRDLQAETQRQATQQDCLPCPGCWAMGTTKSEKVCSEVNNILYWADQSSQGRTTTNQPRKDPLHMYSKGPNLPQFDQLAGTTPLWCLC